MKNVLPQYLITLISVVYLLCQLHLSTSTITTKPRDPTKFSYVKNRTNSTHGHNFPHGIVQDSENLTNNLGGLMLYDFRKMDYMDDWEDLLGVGSKGYTIGAKAKVQFNLSKYDRIVMYGRGVGSFAGYKMVLRHEGKHDKHHPQYEQHFITKPMDHVMELPLSKFKPMYKGYFVKDAPPLNKANITQMEMLVTRDNKEGKLEDTARLELEWMKAMKMKKPIKDGRNETN
ncbi:hypothetical protein WDU94_006083 [Cyamophila willieti]